MSDQDNAVSGFGQSENIDQSSDLGSPVMPEHWSEFVEYITNGVLSEFHSGSYEISEDIVDQLRERLDFGIDDVLVQHQYNLFAAGLKGSEPAEGFAIDDFFPESGAMGINDFFDEYQTDSLENASGSGDDGSAGDSGKAAETRSSFSSLLSDIESEFSNYEDPLGEYQPTESVVSDPVFDLPDMDALPEDSEFEKVAVESNSDYEVVEETEELTTGSDEEPEDEKNQYYGTRQSDSLGEENQSKGPLQAQGVGASLYQMTRSVLHGGANLALGAAGLTAGVGTWGAERFEPLIDKVRSMGRSADNAVTRAEQMTQEQGEEFKQKFREASLAARTEAIADVINQVGAESYFLNGAASDGLDYSIRELINECKTAEVDAAGKEDNKLAKLARHALKEYVSDITVDNLMGRLENIEYGNKLVQTYVDHSLPLLEKLGLEGQEIKSSIEGPLSDFVEDMNGVSKDLEFLLDVAKQSGIMTEEEEQKSAKMVEGLKESVGSMMEKIRGMLAKGSGAAIQPVPQPGM